MTFFDAVIYTITAVAVGLAIYTNVRITLMNRGWIRLQDGWTAKVTWVSRVGDIATVALSNEKECRYIDAVRFDAGKQMFLDLPGAVPTPQFGQDARMALALEIDRKRKAKAQ